MMNKIHFEIAMKFLIRPSSYRPLATVLFIASTANANQVTDITFDTAANMLAYTELELSGEPLAESLGLDLDVLDPDERNKPTEFDYITGIESYEFSEEAMYELNYRSGLGPNLVHGLRNQTRGGDDAGLQQQYAKFAAAVAYPQADMVNNLNLISLPYRAGVPEFATAVDVKTVAKEGVEFFTPNGDLIEKTTLLPAYKYDYSSLKWVADDENAVLEPAAIGALLLKEVMWSQDFLGGMHTSAHDEEVTASASDMDHDQKFSLGVSAIDGLNGLLLTELSLEKMQYLQQVLGFNGEQLGQVITPSYDPLSDESKSNTQSNSADAPIWFPHQIKVSTAPVVNKGITTQKITHLEVVDASSQLRDQWLLLWPLSEYFAFSDQRATNTTQNPAFSAVFDGQPFASAPAVNTDRKTANDVSANDAFSLASHLSNAVFKNMQALHFNDELGTFVDQFGLNDSAKNNAAHITTYDAAYSLVALSIFQRAQDALPVGYASASQNAAPLATAQGKKALQLIEQQADFMLNKLMLNTGLISDGASISNNAGKPSALTLNTSASLDTQFAAMRGLVAAFLATEQPRFRLAARALYLNIEANFYDKQLTTWKSTYSPWSVAAIASGMREAMAHLKNNEKENAAPLALSHLVKRYTDWFRVVVSGRDGEPGLQLAEPLADTGEHRFELTQGDHNSVGSDTENDSDNDGIKQIQAAGGKFGRASVLGNSLIVN